MLDDVREFLNDAENRGISRKTMQYPEHHAVFKVLEDTQRLFAEHAPEYTWDSAGEAIDLAAALMEANEGLDEPDPDVDALTNLVLIIDRLFQLMIVVMRLKGKYAAMGQALAEHKERIAELEAARPVRRTRPLLAPPPEMPGGFSSN